MIHRDIPIINPNNDKLKFAHFASKVADGILNYSQNETYILSIEGEWGSGKTSFINFIEHSIKNSKNNEKYVILHFSPWLITDIRQVVKLFFNELEKVILSNTTGAKVEEFKKDLRNFASIILPESVNIDVGIVKLGYKPKNILLSNINKTLEDVKQSINKYLKELDKKIIIIVDDIDRLTDKETEFIFRLTKGIADFDNLIYILMYDKNVVSRSLEKFKSENGEKYLNKIIQYPLAVPKPHRVTILKLLNEELDVILNDIQSSGKKYFFDKDKRSHLLLPIINKYIKTVRDINQIINIISFEYPLICEEINFIDFFIITIIRLKNATLYDMIKNQPDTFFVNPKNVFEPKKVAEKLKENFENELKKFHSYEDLLKIIFPALTEYDITYSDENIFYASHNNKYICDIYYFENYFSFVIADDKLSMIEYYDIKDKLISSDYEAFKTIILKVDNEQKSPYFLDMFYQLDEPIKTEEIENAFCNTLRVCKLLSSKESSLLFGVAFSYEQLGYSLLTKHENVDEFILNFFEEDELVVPIIKIDLLKVINENKRNEKIVLNDNTLKKLKNLIKEELENITLQNLLNNKYPIYVISRFDDFNASIDNLSEEFNDFIFENINNFFIILKLFEKISTVSSSYADTYDSYSIAKDTLVKLVELDKIENFIEELDITAVNNEQKKLLDYWKNGDKW